MTKIFQVYDIKGPNGFLPIIYTKETLSNAMTEALKDREFKSNIFPEVEPILSKEVLDGSKYNDEHLYLVPIDRSIENIDISNILTPSLIRFMREKDNFKIVYVDYGIPALHPLV